MSQAMQELLGVLDLEQIEHNLFRGNSPKTSWQRVFGGQVVGQALVAAQRTVPRDRFVHSLHCYFMRGGDPSIPIIYQVERMRDGKSFTARRVVAIQHGQTIFSLEASFHVDETGFDHQFDMPSNAQPAEAPEVQIRKLTDGTIPVPEALRRYWRRERPFFMVPVELDHYTSSRKLPPYQNVWVRPNGSVPENRSIQNAILAYLSDLTLLDTSTFPHGISIFDGPIQAASLDHAIWFHRPHRLDDWLLYTQDSPSSSGARGFTRGSIYSREGTLIASVAQEGLVRVRRSHRT